mmetsp:Transcript_17793/g.55595  ORF Transcript_17793/g.55595 Transcript_17793/m.55595 type:complete len:218 (+) Transcript_17793:693-1346(+)
MPPRAPSLPPSLNASSRPASPSGRRAVSVGCGSASLPLAPRASRPQCASALRHTMPSRTTCCSRAGSPTRRAPSPRTASPRWVWVAWSWTRAGASSWCRNACPPPPSFRAAGSCQGDSPIPGNTLEKPWRARCSRRRVSRPSWTGSCPCVTPTATGSARETSMFSSACAHAPARTRSRCVKLSWQTRGGWSGPRSRRSSRARKPRPSTVSCPRTTGA